tara:strand:- start:510 stop:719 length:210 start_codon:yes stop_codon:yes gene_type:complete
MTAKKIISELRKMPPNAIVGFRSHDNREYEIQGWAFSVEHIERDEATDVPQNDQAALDGMPNSWVCISC